jgi:hypothetical protein
VICLEYFITIHLKRFLRYFDDYTNNFVEGMNYAARKMDMAAKPKDNTLIQQPK